LALDEWLTDNLDALEMGQAADRMIHTYSTGMRKRVAFLAAMVHRPKILILDEPTGALDAQSARVVKDQMQLARDRGALVLFTTHVMEIAERLADRIAILNQGSLVADGTLREIKKAYARPGRATLEEIFLWLTASRPEHATKLDDRLVCGRVPSDSGPVTRWYASMIEWTAALPVFWPCFGTTEATPGWPQ
jgi:ABC-type multidrug transport system ATPase subunit